MSNNDQQSSQRERPAWNLPEQVIAYALSVGFLVVLGPFATDALPIATRIAYWALSIGAGWLFITGLIFASRRLPVISDWPAEQRVISAMALAALPTYGSAMMVDGLFRPDGGLPSPLMMLLNFGAIFALISGILLARVRPRLIPPAPLPEHNEFLDRLPPKLGSALISLTAQDHYVEVTTAAGRDLIHMRLSDAIEQLGTYPGQQIHRSHWISAHAFAGLTSAKGQYRAHLLDGRDLPVSRSFLPQVRRMAPVRPQHASEPTALARP